MEIIIRQGQKEDVPELLAIYAPYVTDTAITFEYQVPTIDEFSSRMERIKKRYPFFVALEDDCIVGYAYASQFHERQAYDWAADLSVYVQRDKRKHGIGAALYQELEEVLQEMKIQNLYACIAKTEDDNDPYLTNQSQEFHQHMGFTLAGTFHQCGYKFHRWYDMIWMEKCIGDHAKDMEDVKSYDYV